MVLVQCFVRNSEISNRSVKKGAVMNYLCLPWTHKKKWWSLKNKDRIMNSSENVKNSLGSSAISIMLTFSFSSSDFFKYLLRFIL